MSFKDLRPLYIKKLLAGTQGSDSSLEVVPEELRARWRQKFWTFGEKPLVMKGRYRNRFGVGSDPEFVFSTGEGNAKMDAVRVGLKAGIAAGCDQNERLVELRPWPSKSVVKHVASILAELRWLYRVYSQTHLYAWRAGAFYHGDGIGGHVHFGRKRPTQDKEIDGLDNLALAFCALNLFPMDEWHIRMNGDQRNQFYGLFGDHRPQAHGYEYRALPSWLDSPMQAFLVLTCSKLTVIDPEITQSWGNFINAPVSAMLHIKGLAKYYRGIDDDAALLYETLTSPVPRHRWEWIGENFRERWGLPRGTSVLGRDVQHYILPNSIRPEPVEIEDVENFLIRGAPLPFREVAANFTHSIPDNYRWAPANIATERRPGYGDLIHDMVWHRAWPFNITQTDDMDIGIPMDLWDVWTEEERRKSGGFRFGNRANICIPRAAFDAKEIGSLRHLLYDSGLFPLWRVSDVREDSYREWEIHHIKSTKKKIRDEGRKL